jgi:hypothetical protein
MKQLSLATLFAAILWCGAPLHSQAPKPAPLDQLKTLKDKNEKLLDQQTKTLQALDDLLKNAQQLRIFARRT